MTFELEDYLKPHFDFNKRELGFRIGVPILDHEIRKQPSIRPKWTGYDKQEIHSFHLHSIAADSLVIGFSFRRQQWVDFIGGKKKSGETNCNAQVFVRLFVTQDHRIATKQPTIKDVNCKSSGFGVEQLLDHLASGLSFLVSGGKEQFGLFDFLAGIGAVGWNLKAIFSDPIVITDPVQRSILSSQMTLWVNKIWDFDRKENEVYLSQLRYDPKGVWLIFSYPKLLQGSAVALLPNGMLIKGSDHAIYVIDNGKRRWIPSPARFNELGYKWEAVIGVPDEALASLAQGPNM